MENQHILINSYLSFLGNLWVCSCVEKMWETKFSESQFPVFWELNKLMLRSIFINIFCVGKFSLSLLQWSYFFYYNCQESFSVDGQIDWPYKWWENARKWNGLFIWILSNSTLRETNNYSNYWKKKINTRRETHKVLIIIHNISKEKARFKRQREKNLK